MECGDDEQPMGHRFIKEGSGCVAYDVVAASLAAA